MKSIRYMMLALCIASTIGYFKPIIRHHTIIKSLKSSARPTLDDVERISKGQAAKKRGTGSRQVPHRLNAEERIEWDNAKLRNYLLLRGSGWRRERGDSPLANIYRQICDAKNIPCISISKGTGVGGSKSTTNPVITINDLTSDKSDDNQDTTATTSSESTNKSDIEDTVIIDFSTLRTGPTDQIKAMATFCIQLAQTTYASSLLKIDDNSDMKLLGWSDEEVDLDSFPIWRIPVQALKVTFTSRGDSRKYVETIVEEFIEGTGAASKVRKQYEYIPMKKIEDSEIIETVE